MMQKPSVLFLSAHDAILGPMASTLLRALAPDRFDVMSAGVEPHPEMHPLARRVLEEIGLDVGAFSPRSVREYLARTRVTVAVILGDGGPGSPRVYPFAPSTLHWMVDAPLDEALPEAERLERFRKIRDSLRARILNWIGDREGAAESAESGEVVGALRLV